MLNERLKLLDMFTKELSSIKKFPPMVRFDVGQKLLIKHKQVVMEAIETIKFSSPSMREWLYDSFMEHVQECLKLPKFLLLGMICSVNQE